MRHLLRVILEPFLSEFTIIESEKLHELDFIMRKIDGERNLDRDHGEAQRLHFLRHPGMNTKTSQIRPPQNVNIHASDLILVSSVEAWFSLVFLGSEPIQANASIFPRISRNCQNF